MRLCHPPDGSTSPKYKLLCFIKTKKNCKEKNALAFNWDRCCHLVLCLRLIPFHWHTQIHWTRIEKACQALKLVMIVKSFIKLALVWPVREFYYKRVMIVLYNCSYSGQNYKRVMSVIYSSSSPNRRHNYDWKECFKLQHTFMLAIYNRNTFTVQAPAFFLETTVKIFGRIKKHKTR